MSTPPALPFVAKAFAGAGRGSARESLARRQLVLQSIPLFQGLSKRQRRSIGRIARISAFRAGDRLVTEGATGSVLGVVLDGRVRVVKKGRTVARMDAGAIFGEVAVLDPGPRTASIVAQTDGECLTIGGKELWKLLSTEPRMGAEIARVLATRLREVSGRPDDRTP